MMAERYGMLPSEVYSRARPADYIAFEQAAHRMAEARKRNAPKKSISENEMMARQRAYQARAQYER